MNTARLAAAARSIHLDGVAAEIAGAFRESGIPSILVRGPSIARHLYAPGESRDYVDVDLLVAPGTTVAAERILADHGFRHLNTLGHRPGDRPTHARTWSRAADEASVDLHHTIIGTGVEPAECWKILTEHIEPLDVARTRLDGLDAEATAAAVALHAAQHGIGVGRPLDDLSHALERLPFATWQSAAALAERLAATSAFAAGLRLLPPGDELARRLDLPTEMTAEILLRASSAPQTALGFDWLSQTPGVRAKVVLVAGKVAPPPDFMRARWRVARAGRTGLALAYAWRPVWLLWHAGPGLRAWLAARQRARG